MNAHLSADTIAAYFLDTLADADQVLVEEHVADCDTCALAAQGALAAGTVIDQWTARAHGVAATRALLAGALATAGERATVAAVRERLAAWVERLAGRAEAALRIVLEAPGHAAGQAASALAENVPDLAPPGAAWQFAAAPAPVPTRGAARRGRSQPIVVTAGGPGGLTARLAVSGERGEVVVRLDDVPRGTDPPLVLLIPTERGSQSEPRLATPTPSPGSEGWIVRFEGLGPGAYLVVFEPLP